MDVYTTKRSTWNLKSGYVVYKTNDLNCIDLWNL